MKSRNILLVISLFVFLVAGLIAFYSLPEVNAQSLDAVRIGNRYRRLNCVK